MVVISIPLMCNVFFVGLRLRPVYSFKVAFLSFSSIYDSRITSIHCNLTNVRYIHFCRVFIVVMCVVGICWVPIITEFQGGQLFIYIQAISAYLAPPVASVYLIAIFWKRSNEKVRASICLSALLQIPF